MTTYFNFQPSSQAPYQFQPTLDGQTYTIIVTWSLFGRRYYVNCYSLSGVLVFSLPMIGSPAGLALTDLSWTLGVATAKTILPHNFKIGATVLLTIAGVTPDAYNGIVKALVTGPSTFTYQITSDPGGATIYGTSFQNLNLAGGYFSSTLVFRQPNNQFEVSL